MKIIIDEFGKSIHKKDNHIQIKQDNEIILDELAENITNITIMGKGSITFDALNLISKNNIPCISVNHTGQINYIITNPESYKYAQLLKDQIHHSESEDSIKISKEIIKSKIQNQKYTLKTLNKNHKKEEITQIEQQLDQNIKKIEQTKTKNEIMGIEGLSSQKYWQAIKTIIPEQYNFTKRTKRPAKDLLNAMLNYGYAILASQITIKILQTGLNPSIGLLHTTQNYRTSLTYDIIEQFRQQLVDKPVLSIINNKQIKPEDYTNQTINYEKRKIIIEKILEKIESQITYQNKKTTYEEIIEQQTKQLKKSIQEKQEYKGFYLHW